MPERRPPGPTRAHASPEQPLRSPLAVATAPPPVAAHQHDPILAAALFSAWSGDPAVVVASPPGAGKTRLVVHLAEQLHRRAGLSVAIAAQTRAQALDVTNRAAALGASVALLGGHKSSRPLGLDPKARYLEGAAYLGRWRGVAVATTARWLWVPERQYTADVCIVDEAWQLTYANLGGLAPLSAQVVLVGDPGQIAPVVTGNTSRWQAWVSGPQCPAPQALIAGYPTAVTLLRLPHTWRLGPQTTALIQPAFYADLPFVSARSPRHLVLAGRVLPELSAQPVTALAGPGDASLATTAAGRARDLLELGSVIDEHGQERRLRPEDLAIITPHVEQATAIAARLADLPGVLIGTANQAQGLEREAVVVIHPLAGYREAPAFAVDTGRLCVALSRHRAHVTVVLDVATDAVLRHAQAEAPSNTTLAIQRSVLTVLLGTV